MNPPTMSSLPPGYRALVVGARGALGAAFAEHLRADPRCGGVVALHRASAPPLDYDDEAGLGAAFEALGPGPFQRVIVATGVLHGDGFAPEKRLADLRYASLETVFRLNTFGPALVLRHALPRLDRACGRLAVLSAKVGSVGDNRLGGWTAYRASKAALNMVLKNAAIEAARTHPGAALVALHPGTVASALSRPFRGDEIGRPPALAAAQMLGVLDTLRAEDSGSFVAYDGQRLPW